MIDRKTDAELNKKRGQRLKECRNRKEFSQAQLASAVGYEHPNSISYFESGKRALDWNKVIPLARELDVNPAFIMCETDKMQNYSIWDTAPTSNIDNIFISLICLIQTMGYNLSFFVVKLFDGIFPDTKASDGRIKEEWESLEIECCYHELLDIQRDTAHCVLFKDNEKSEAIISKVQINNWKISFGLFAFLLLCIERAVYNILDEAPNEYELYSYFINGLDGSIHSEICETRCNKHGVIGKESLEHLLTHIKELYGDDSVKILSEKQMQNYSKLSNLH